MSKPATLGQLKAPDTRPEPSARSCATTCSTKLRSGEPVVHGHHRLRGHGRPRRRERDPRRPRHDLPRRARPGEVPHHARARRSCWTKRCPAIAGLRDQRRPARADLRARAGSWSPSRATTTPIAGCAATTATARSSRRRTSRSPTSSVRSTRSRSPKAATSRTSSRSTSASSRGRTAGSSRSTSCPTSPSGSRSALFNLLEERDMQIRGYRVRLPMDMMLVRVGEPRGLHEPRTDHHAAQGPLRRQIRTHYPPTPERRGRDRRARRPSRSRRGDRGCVVPALHEGRSSRSSRTRRAAPAGEPALGCVGASVDRELRDASRANAL